MGVFDLMRTTLADAMAHRDERPDFDPVTGELGWVLFERQAMLVAVNERRASAGLDPVTLGDVERVETSACGHIDYARKFAWGCAELVEMSAPRAADRVCIEHVQEHADRSEG
ncbi:hypothetical protein [Microbacterium enclense]|uniref:hypothetical protein n=1 Tax=Microbacterium enclense TaxID=993073 RepID=UPI003F81AEA1